MKYVGPASDVSYYCVHQVHESEGKELEAWYQTVTKNEVLYNRPVLEH